jgi:hypothetical protein
VVCDCRKHLGCRVKPDNDSEKKTASSKA